MCLPSLKLHLTSSERRESVSKMVDCVMFLRTLVLKGDVQAVHLEESCMRLVIHDLSFCSSAYVPAMTLAAHQQAKFNFGQVWQAATDIRSISGLLTTLSFAFHCSFIVNLIDCKACHYRLTYMHTLFVISIPFIVL